MKTRTLAITAMLAATLGLTGAARASSATYDFGVHDYPDAESSLDVGGGAVTGLFTDYYKFSMPVGFDLVAGVVVSNNIGPGDGSGRRIENGWFSLYANPDGIVNNGDETLVGGVWSYDGTTGSTQHVTNISAGNYYYAVGGVGSGFNNKGIYTLTSQINPVPEPETYGMMLAGLGLIGVLARRRQR